MSTAAQTKANRQNAQLSSGPKTDEGKANSAHNNFRYGLTGNFCILGWEKEEEYDELFIGLVRDHQPADNTEKELVKTMAQSSWLRQRALFLQQTCFEFEIPMTFEYMEKQLALYLRYQTTHDRAFNKALDQLLKLRADKRKQEIGFESQERKRKEDERKRSDEERKRSELNRKETEQQLAAERRETHEKRRAAAETRAQELHQARLWRTVAQAQRHEREAGSAKAQKAPCTHQPEASKAA